MENNFRAIGNKLYAFRKRISMTQSEVAEAAGISDRTYADIERGTTDMRISTFIKICSVLRVTPNEILQKDSQKTKISTKELFEKLNNCTEKEREIAYELINVYLKGL